MPHVFFCFLGCWHTTDEFASDHELLNEEVSLLASFLYVIDASLCMGESKGKEGYKTETYHFAWADQREKQGYNWKEGYNSNISQESYAHNWWINLWSKGVAILTHNALSQLFTRFHIQGVTWI